MCYTTYVESTPIAIVGVSCRFANAADPGEFWRLIMHQKSGIGPLGVDTALLPGVRNLFDRPYPTHGGLLGRLYACVPGDQNFPRQINKGENQDLYFAVQMAFDALVDAGMRPRSRESQRGTVRFGYAPPFNAATVNWLNHTLFIDQTMDIIGKFFRNAPAEAMENVRRKLIDSLPAPNAASFLAGTGHRIAAWIGHESSFTGGATTIDSGPLSGVAALRAAMDDLRSGRADVALAGALTPPLNRAFLEGVSGEMLFSKDADLLPFDRNARGTLPGEGGAFFVLKREADALAANDRIYALVRSVFCGSMATTDVLESATRRADVPYSSIGLIEAEGCGVPEMDAAEVEAIQHVLGPHRPGGALIGIGSVKGNVGHCFHAAAAAGLLKAAIALRRRILPPQMPVLSPLEALTNRDSSIYLLNEARPWITGDPSSPRRAVVLVDNARGGRRAAVVLEEEPEGRERQ